jgi:hypothetical protein
MNVLAEAGLVALERKPLFAVAAIERFLRAGDVPRRACAQRSVFRQTPYAAQRTNIGAREYDDFGWLRNAVGRVPTGNLAALEL